MVPYDRTDGIFPKGKMSQQNMLYRILNDEFAQIEQQIGRLRER